MKLQKLNIIFFTIIALLALSTPCLAAEWSLPPDSDSLRNESFILLPGDNNNANTGLTSKTSPFPAFFLVDTTLSTIVVDEELSINVELHKVDFMVNSNPEDTVKRLIKGDLALMPRKKPAVLPSKNVHVKISL